MINECILIKKTFYVALNFWTCRLGAPRQFTNPTEFLQTSTYCMAGANDMKIGNEIRIIMNQEVCQEMLRDVEFGLPTLQFRCSGSYCM